MTFNFELFLLVVTLLTGLDCLIDWLFFAESRRQNGITKVSLRLEYSRSFFPILLVVLLLRSFLIEPYRIPTGSDEPTLLVGDFIVANKFIYGLRLPVFHNKIVTIGEPKIGDIALFRYPVNPSQDFIKRIIGGPGDRISYINKILYVNGKEASQQLLGTAVDKGENGDTWSVEERLEDLNGIRHKIYVRPDVPAQDFSVVVPPGEYFAMGDNRDDSNDSRYWGFVPEQNLVGKAFAVWFSWQGERPYVRWSRVGTPVN